MPIHYEIEVDGSLLSAKAWGAHDNISEVKRYGAALVAAGIESGCTKALLDETGLDHTLNEGDIYFLAQYYSVWVPHLVKAAIVFNSKDNRNVAFWETCAVNRGLSVRVFKTREEALNWLMADELPKYA